MFSIKTNNTKIFHTQSSMNPHYSTFISYKCIQTEQKEIQS